MSRSHVALLLLVAITAISAYPSNCPNRITHLIERANIFQSTLPDVEAYRAMFAYFEDRLLHNKTYTACYNYTNQFCQLATTKVLPTLFSGLKQIQTAELSAVEYHYVNSIVTYFLQRCGLNLHPLPETLEKDAFNRAACRNTSARIYAFLTSRDRVDVARVGTYQYSLLVKSALRQFESAEYKKCFSPQSKTGIDIIKRIDRFVQETKPDRTLLAEIWRFVAFFGVEYLKDAGLDLNVTRVCDRDLGRLLQYTEIPDGSRDFQGFNISFWKMHTQSRCFRTNKQCRVFRNRLENVYLSSDFVPTTPNEFANWFGLIRFNVRHYIYNCYFNGGNDTNSSIWTRSYTFSNPNCTARVAEIVGALRSTEVEALGNLNVSNPIVYYLKEELHRIGQDCLEKNATCIYWDVTTRGLFNWTLWGHEDRFDDEKEVFWSGYHVAKLNALKYINVCSPQQSQPAPGPGGDPVIRCSVYLETFRRAIQSALSKNDFMEAVTQLRENKVVVEQYRECNIDKGKSQLCLDLSQQLRENYVRALFSSDLETLSQKLEVIVRQLADVTEECTIKK